MRVIRPAKGYQANPLRNYRNVICPCPNGQENGVKTKRCCGRVHYITHELADMARAYLANLSAMGVITVRPSDIRRDG